MTLRLRGRLLLALPLLVGSIALGLEACTDSAPSSDPSDGGFPAFDVGTDDAAERNDAAAGDDAAGDDADVSADSGADAAVDPTLPITCKSLKAGNPALTSGLYTVDLDGNRGDFPSISVYCDMAFDGGGWTMIQSFTGSNSPSNLTGAVDAGPGLLVGIPRPGSLGGLSGPYVSALAQLSEQVHIRLSFESNAGSDGGTWVTSRALPDGAPTRVIQNLRNLDVLTKDTDGGFEDWTGPQATATKLAWVPLYGGGPGTCLNPVQATKYPSIYWACGNFDSMNLYAPQSLCRWTFTPNSGNEPMEVLVR